MYVEYRKRIAGEIKTQVLIGPFEDDKDAKDYMTYVTEVRLRDRRLGMVGVVMTLVEKLEKENDYLIFPAEETIFLTVAKGGEEDRVTVDLKPEVQLSELLADLDSARSRATMDQLPGSKPTSTQSESARITILRAQ